MVFINILNERKRQAVLTFSETPWRSLVMLQVQAPQNMEHQNTLFLSVSHTHAPKETDKKSSYMTMLFFTSAQTLSQY